ncbi:MAG: decaprenyl-phosphate phosphoribosyltransferase [Phycisphaerae bacterium]
MMIKDCLRLARPDHWVKNAIVLLPVIFAQRMGDAGAWLLAGLAATAFCFASSAVYITNDIRDREADRLHPRKRNRPLAAGRVNVPAAVIEAALFFLVSVGLALAVGLGVVLLIAAYVILQTSYTYYFKNRMILDVIFVALGFVLRAAAGAVAIHAAVSAWLVICTFTLCLFMGFCKRYTEVATLTDPEQAKGHRVTLDGYSTDLLTHLITLSATIAIISFLLYTISPRTIREFNTGYLVGTLPLVVYGVCRFTMLSMFARYADPTDLILRDRPLQMTAVLWVLMSAAIVLWGKHLPNYLQIQF